MGFGASVKSVLSQYATFRGRATRSEFWWFSLLYYLLIIVSAVLNGTAGSLLLLVVLFGLLIPSLAVQVRRLHDIGYSGWLSLIVVIPYLGALALLCVLMMDGTHGPNQYGPDPKNRASIDFDEPTYY
ncbi:DUF805 domain-containing protein [Nocardia sp. NPDC059240]|uniref:DUF805 domain-containing protein n=1 Tax=Nocardia sp. NPDC059240 TaxID=3346786 RepID=UPI00369AC0E8